MLLQNSSNISNECHLLDISRLAQDAFIYTYSILYIHIYIQYIHVCVCVCGFFNLINLLYHIEFIPVAFNY